MMHKKRGELATIAIVAAIMLLLSGVVLITQFRGITGFVTLDFDNISSESINNSITIEFNETGTKVVYLELDNKTFKKAVMDIKGKNILNPHVDVLDDSDIEFSYSGIYNSTSTIDDFSDSLNNYLANCGSYPCVIAVRVNAESAGVIVLKTLVLEYEIEDIETNVSEPLEGGIVNETVNETIVNETILLNETVNETNQTIIEPIEIQLHEKVEQEVIEKFDTEEEVRVIVVLKDSVEVSVQEGKLENKKQKIRIKQDKVLSDLSLESSGVGIASADVDFKLGHKYSTVNAFSGRVTRKGIEKLKNDPDVAYVYTDKPVKAFLDDSVPLIHADDVWEKQIDSVNITGDGETVCVIDSGIDYNHTDLGGGWGNKIIGGFRSLDSGSDVQECESNHSACYDDRNHGTHVAGIISSENETYRGVAPDADLVAVKVLNASGEGWFSDFIAGIDWCVDNASKFNISVISLSLGSSPPNLFDSACDSSYPATAIAINIAVGQGIFVVVASGNDGNSTHISSPACITNATSVGATTKSDTFAIYTNKAPILDMLAPGGMPFGGEIISLAAGGGTTGMFGTSMATPHVAGAAALIIQDQRLQGNSIAPDEIKELLVDHGVDVSGYPRIDLFEISLYPVPPTIYLVSPPNGTTTNQALQTFTCNITDDSAVKSLSLYIWNSSGNLLFPPNLNWNKTTGGTGAEKGLDITIDSSGNLYVTGSKKASGAQHANFLTLKYNSAGDLLWSKTAGGSGVVVNPFDFYDAGRGITLDPSGNVYVTGYTHSFGAGTRDVWTLKYNSAGDLLWNRTFGGDIWDEGNGITTDSFGNIYVVGTTGILPNVVQLADILILKYNSAGDLLWNRTIGNYQSAFDSGNGITTDPSGNIYIVGYTWEVALADYRIWILKYDSSGNLLWNKTTGRGHNSIGYGITLDPSMNIYIAGITEVGSAWDLWVSKHNPSGDLLWNRTAGGSNHDLAQTIAIDFLGNVYVAGYTRSFGAGEADFWILKYDSSGNLLWDKTEGGIDQDYGSGVTTDPSGNVYVVGSTTSFGSGLFDVWLLKYSDLKLVSGISDSTSFTFSLPYEDNFTWNCLGYDTAGNSDWSQEGNYTLIYDITPPKTTLVSPEDNTITENTSLIFTCNATDDYNLTNLTLHIWNSTETFYQNTTAVTGTYNESSWNVLGLNLGEYEWNCLAYNNAERFDWADNNRTFEIIPRISVQIHTLKDIYYVSGVYSADEWVNLTDFGPYLAGLLLHFDDTTPNTAVWYATVSGATDSALNGVYIGWGYRNGKVKFALEQDVNLENASIYYNPTYGHWVLESITEIAPAVWDGRDWANSSSTTSDLPVSGTYANGSNSATVTITYMPGSTIIVDNSSYNHNVTADPNSAGLSHDHAGFYDPPIPFPIQQASVKKFGPTSILFNTAGNRLSLIPEFDDGDLAVEFWISHPLGSSTILDWRIIGGVVNKGFSISVHNSPEYGISVSSAYQHLFADATFTLGQWHHIAVTKKQLSSQQAEFTIFLDGEKILQNTTWYYEMPSGNEMYFGSYGYDGVYLDEFRIVEGVIYTGNFIPPTSLYNGSGNVERENQSFALSDINTTIWINLTTEYFNGSTWLFDWNITSMYEANLTANLKLGLDTIWNNLSKTNGFNVANATHGQGTYRAKVDILTASGILINSSAYNFTIETPPYPYCIDGSGIIEITENTTWTDLYVCDVITITNNAVLNLSGPSYNLTTNILIIDSGSSITSTNNGYSAGAGPCPGNSFVGASHGGKGYNNDCIHDLSFQPSEPGSGAVGEGGGSIRLNILNKFIHHGSVTSDAGENAAGGSILVIVNNSLNGSGTFYARGTGMGGGGRIAVYYGSTNFTHDLMTLSSAESTGNGLDGTIIFIDKTKNQAVITNGFRFQDNDPRNDTGNTLLDFTNLDILKANNVVLNKSSVEITISQNLSMHHSTIYSQGNDILKINSNEYNQINTTLSTGIINITATNLFVDNTSIISAEAGGYQGGNSSTTPGFGPGGGFPHELSSGGAGHGSYGGPLYMHLGYGLPYGNAFYPTEFGSGGGGTAYGRGGHGGGIIHIFVDDTLTLDGRISADAEFEFIGQAGGGSGGSILINTSAIKGQGWLSAKGAKEANYSYYSGGGSGGRIAVYANTINLDSLTTSTVRGGVPYVEHLHGYAGTLIFLNTPNIIIVSGFRFEQTNFPTGIVNYANITILSAEDITSDISNLTISADDTLIINNSEFLNPTDILNLLADNIYLQGTEFYLGGNELFIYYHTSFDDTNAYYNNTRLTIRNDLDIIEFSLLDTAYNLSQNIDLNDSLVRVDSNEVPGLNVSANITMFGAFIEHNLSNPKIFMSQGSRFIYCPDSICKKLELTQTYIKFNVTHFTVFKVEDQVPILAPYPVHTYDDINASFEYVHKYPVTGDIHFEWLVNDISVHTESFTSLANGTIRTSVLGSGNFSLNDNVTAIAWLTSGPETSTKRNSTITISSVAPEIVAIPNQLAYSGQLFNYDANATNPDNIELYWDINTTVLEINHSTGLITKQILDSDVGLHQIKINITGGAYYDEEEFNLTVLDATSPVISNIILTPDPAYTNNDLNASVIYYDVTSGNITFSWYVNATNVYNQTITGVTNSQQVSSVLTSTYFVKHNNITVQAYAVSDSLNSITKQENITIENFIPQIDPIPHLYGYSGSNFTYNITAVDYDNDSLTWAINTTLITINSSTGALNDTPLEIEKGTYSIKVNVTDGENYTEQIFNYTITDVLYPGQITNLNNVYRGFTWLYWNWTNPVDIDFDHVEVWIDNVFYTNTINNYYNATSLNIKTDYTIQLKTVDIDQNINPQSVNNTATTLNPNNVPYLEDLEFEPYSPNAYEDTIVTAVYLDDDAQNGTIYFTWKVNQITVKQYAVNATNGTLINDILAVGNYTLGDNITLTAYAYDEIDNSTTYTLFATIGLIAPKINSIDISPDPIGMGKNTTITVNVTQGNNSINTVWLNITRPNQVNDTIEMNNIGSDLWQANYRSFANGIHLVDVYANDTINLVEKDSSNYTVRSSLQIGVKTEKDTYIGGLVKLFSLP